ncbi:MAG: PAS domain S-box protein [Acidobacteria bacterium]|nr:PAS domain S-box protein [Acidobacteriota bacterium]
MKLKKTPKKEESTPKKLLNLKKKTSWSWERMCREFHRVMGEEGPSHTTLFRYAEGKVQRRNVLTERYVREAIQRITVELIQQELSESEAQREDVQEELHQTEVRYRQLVENARDVIYRYRPTNPPSFEYISPATQDILGYAPKEFYDDPKLLEKLVHPDDLQMLEQGLQGKSPFHERATLRYRHRDGRVIWVERVNVPIHDKAGRLVAVEGIARDVTETKSFEQALLSVIEGTSWTGAENFPRSLIKQLAAALQIRFAFLAELHPSLKNRVCLLALWDGSGYRKLFEYDIEHTPCKHVFTNGLSYHPADLQKIFPKDAWLKENGIESYLAVPVYGPTGKPIGHLGVMHDGPMPEGPPRESILRVFATCAGNELAHKKRTKVS